MKQQARHFRLVRTVLQELKEILARLPSLVTKWAHTIEAFSELNHPIASQQTKFVTISLHHYKVKTKLLSSRCITTNQSTFKPSPCITTKYKTKYLGLRSENEWITESTDSRKFSVKGKVDRSNVVRRIGTTDTAETPAAAAPAWGVLGSEGRGDEGRRWGPGGEESDGGEDDDGGG